MDDWLHLEQMSDRHWWLNLGGVGLSITIGPSGEAVVRVQKAEILSMGGGESILTAKAEGSQ